MATALIKFDQGPNSDVAGNAVIGTTSDGAVTVSNGNDTGVVSWQFDLLYVPPGSALSPTTQGPAAAATFAFTPDVPGSYRVRLTVFDAGGSSNADIRNFGVPFPGFGLIAPPYQRDPAPIPLTGILGKPDEMNFGGQPHGWDGVDTGAKLLFQALSLLDGLSAGGEANTASNIGGANGLFKVKTGINLEFLTLAAGANITITLVGDTLEFSAVVGSGETNTGANLGAGAGIFAQKNGVTLEFKSLVAGDNVTITPGANELTIAAADGEVNLGANVGGGNEVFRNKTAATLNFRTLVAGANVTITPIGDTLQITAAAGTGEANTASNVGTGVGIFKQKVSDDLEFHKVLAGANTTVTLVGDDVKVDATATGNSEVALTITSPHVVESNTASIFSPRTSRVVEDLVVQAAAVTAVAGGDFTFQLFFGPNLSSLTSIGSVTITQGTQRGTLAVAVPPTVPANTIFVVNTDAIGSFPVGTDVRRKRFYFHVRMSTP